MEKPDQSQLSDEEILRLTRSPETEEAGFRLLIKRYQERLYWVIRGMVKDHEDTNDVLQNCLLKVYRSLHTFQGQSQLFTWLYRVAVNEAITFANQRAKKNTDSLEHNSQVENRAGESGWQPEGDEIRRLLDAAIDSLPEKQKLVFRMRYFDELNYEEMSEMLGTSVGALKASFHHAVKKVEEQIRKLEIL